MASEAYSTYKELVQEERFGPRDAIIIPSTAVNMITTRRDRFISRYVKTGLLTICLCSAVYFLVVNRLVVTAPSFRGAKSHLKNTPTFTDDIDRSSSGHVGGSGPAKRVPLEAHIMSKCPDAKECLQQLVIPAMEQISNKVDFQLSFIGSVSNESSEVECKHGPSECIGDMLILCASHLPFSSTELLSPSLASPRMPTIRSLGFANCLLSSYQNIPQRELVEDCALEHGIDFEALNQCASRQDDDDRLDSPRESPSGIALLRRSARRSEQLGVKTSCTVRLDESVWCVRDGGAWTNCAKDGEEVPILVKEIEKLWQERNE